MSLKSKLVLAITSLVFLVTMMLSLVYINQLLQAVVTQSTTACGSGPAGAPAPPRP